MRAILLVPLFIVVAIYVSLYSTAIPVRAQEETSQLTLVLPAEAEAGTDVLVVARLTGPDGSPIADAEITFTADYQFLNVFDTVELGRSISGEDGAAELRYEPRVGGEVTIFAEFEGNRSAPAATASGMILTTPGGQVYDELPPFRIPGANLWMAVAILSSVWLVFVIAMANLGIGIYRSRETRETFEGSDA